jgi:hypothetical protein
MRMLMKVNIPVVEGNAAIANGSLGSTIAAILADLKPEAAYFVEDHGMRTGILVFDMADPSKIPGVAEPWFLAFNAKVELHPAMTLEDLKSAGPAIESVVKKYAPK